MPNRGWDQQRSQSTALRLNQTERLPKDARDFMEAIVARPIYERALEITRRLSGGQETAEDRDSFVRLYWGELVVMETREVESAMALFRRALQAAKRKEAVQKGFTEMTANENPIAFTDAIRAEIQNLGEVIKIWEPNSQPSTDQLMQAILAVAQEYERAWKTHMPSSVCLVRERNNNCEMR